MDLEMQSIGIVRETKLTARRICYRPRVVIY